MDIVRSLFDYITANPLLAIGALFVASFIWQRMQPFPDENEGPEQVSGIQQWQELMGTKDNSVVVCDFYATWCPPCKTAAPLYSNMSKQPQFSAVKFRKCNVDKASDVAAACKIQAMPTFKVFKNGIEVGVVQGWNESKLKSVINDAMKKSS